MSFCLLNSFGLKIEIPRAKTIMKVKNTYHRHPILSDQFVSSGIDLLDSFFSGTANGELRVRKPKAQIIEDDKAYAINLEVAGFKKEDVEIEVQDHILSISAKQENKAETKGKFILDEFGPLNFKRSFKLNSKTDRENISAVVKDGILTIHIPKSKDAGTKQIKIK